MIVQALASRNLFRHLLLISLVLLPALITVAINGVRIHVPEDATMYYQWLAAWVESLTSPWLEMIVAGFYLLVILSLNRLSRLPGFYSRTSKLAPIFLGLLCLFLFSENLGLHPTLVALLFLIPAIRNLLMSGEAQPSPSRIFNAGFYAALASLFSFPIILFLPSFFVILFVFRLYRWNYSGMLASGMLLPWVYALLVGWLGGFYPLQEIYGLTGIWLSGVMYVFSYIDALFTFTHYALIILMLVFIVSAFLAVYTKLDQRVLGIRYLYRSILWLSIPGIPYAIVSGGMMIQSLMAVVFFITIIGATYLREVKRPLRVNLLLWGILALMYLGYFI